MAKRMTLKREITWRILVGGRQEAERMEEAMLLALELEAAARIRDVGASGCWRSGGHGCLNLGASPLLGRKPQRGDLLLLLPRGPGFSRRPLTRALGACL